MKIIKTFSGAKFRVDDDEAEMISKLFNSESLVKLRSGQWINTRAIEMIENDKVEEIRKEIYLEGLNNPQLKNGKQN